MSGPKQWNGSQDIKSLHTHKYIQIRKKLFQNRQISTYTVTSPVVYLT